MSDTKAMTLHCNSVWSLHKSLCAHLSVLPGLCGGICLFLKALTVHTTFLSIILSFPFFSLKRSIKVSFVLQPKLINLLLPFWKVHKTSWLKLKFVDFIWYNLTNRNSSLNTIHSIFYHDNVIIQASLIKILMKFQVLPSKIKRLYCGKTHTTPSCSKPENSFMTNSIILQKMRFRERYFTIPKKISHVKMSTCETGTEMFAFSFLK